MFSLSGFVGCKTLIFVLNLHDNSINICQAVSFCTADMAKKRPNLRILSSFISLSPIWDEASNLKIADNIPSQTGSDAFWFLQGEERDKELKSDSHYDQLNKAKHTHHTLTQLQWNDTVSFSVWWHSGSCPHEDINNPLKWWLISLSLSLSLSSPLAEIIPIFYKCFC